MRYKIAVGSILVSAHKGQVKIPSQIGRRRNWMLNWRKDDCEHGQSSSVPGSVEKDGLNSRGTKRRFEEMEDSEEEFLGFTTSPKPPPPSSSELHPRGLQSIQQPVQNPSSLCLPTLRRSNRKKTKKIGDDFVYFQ